MEKVYGIDLGTTNSLIGYHDKIFGGLVPSIVNLKTGEAGKSLKGNYSKDIVRSFKKDMSCGESGQISIAASSRVLQKLCDIVKKETGETVKNVVITVPAYFLDNERYATIEAAKRIGLNVERIINEPTAASIKYNENKKHLTVVYDLGGGTFDVSIIDSRFGDYDVQASDGGRIGGDDLDKAIKAFVMSKVNIKLHLFGKEDHDKLKDMCEHAKIELQKTKSDYVLDLSSFGDAVDVDSFTLTVVDYVKIMRTVFKETIVLTKSLIEKNIMAEEFLFILVGGSTHCPYLIEYIKEEIGVTPQPLDYDPDKLVAEGACYCAQLRENGEDLDIISDVISKPIGIDTYDGTFEAIIPAGSKLPIKESRIFKNPVDGEGLRLSVFQGDSKISKFNSPLGTMYCPFGRERKAWTVNVTVTILVNEEGIVTIKAKLPLQPEKEMVLKRGNLIAKG